MNVYFGHVMHYFETFNIPNKFKWCKLDLTNLKNHSPTMCHVNRSSRPKSFKTLKCCTKRCTKLE